VNHYKFTGDEHDTESNLEHTPFRQLSTVQGRWLSPDPYLGSMDLTNPQKTEIDSARSGQCRAIGE